MSEDGCAPYNTLVQAYKHLSAHPKQWKLVYSVSNTRAYEAIADVHLKVMCERAIRKRIKSYNPDVVISVHPLMTNVPVVSCAKIGAETGRHLPIFTVVTDLASGHCLWFANGVEKMFIASDQIRALAKSRGKVPDDKLVQTGLPIRNDFSVQAEALGDRMSSSGKHHQKSVRCTLGLDPEKKTILLMGGGEGVGALSKIVDSLYVELVEKGIDASIVVVCGRNEKLKKKLAERNWTDVLKRKGSYGEDQGCWVGSMSPSSQGCLDGTVTSQLRRIISTSSMNGGTFLAYSKAPPPVVASDEESDVDGKSELNGVISTSSTDRSPPKKTEGVINYQVAPASGSVNVVGLGFVANMAEYMVAANVLVSKAGPGTIAEAAALGLPVLLTNFLPGQEEGNVDFVVDGQFGAYRSDADPTGIAEEVVNWLTDEEKLRRLSAAARSNGSPNAAAEIVRIIGDSTIHWKELNCAQTSTS